jgi:hypothetical protein
MIADVCVPALPIIKLLPSYRTVASSAIEYTEMAESPRGHVRVRPV